MGVVDSLFEDRSNNVDVAYRNLRDVDRDFVVGLRRHIDELWQRYRPFADRDFVAEFPRRPQERFWEMYLACSLLDMDMDLRKSDPGPDILVVSEGKRVWIEATTPTPGNSRSADRVPDLVPLSEGGTAQTVPVDKIVLRYTASLEEKRRKFLAYRQKGIVSDDDICVIAISGAHLAPRGGYGDTVPYIVRAVFPFGSAYVTFDRESFEIVDRGHTLQESVRKSSGTDIPTTAFLSAEYEQVAALVFGPNAIGNTPERMGTDLITVHNPKASRPLSSGFLPRGRAYWLVENDTAYQLHSQDYNHSPLVSSH